MLSRLGLWALVLPLSACVSLTPTAPGLPDIAAPAAWSTTPAITGNANLNLAQWWQRFDDPLLATLILQALQANTSVRSAQAALLQARALRDVAAAGLLPGVTGSASAQRSKSGNASPGNVFNAGFDASWEPDVFGGNRNALQAGEASAQASAASLADVQVSIAAEVAIGYIQYRGAQSRLAIARDNLASQLETLQITGWRVQAGLLTSLEGEQARAASEQTQAQIPTLETSVAQFRHSLELLCGQTPDALRAQLASPSPVPQAQNNLALNMPAETLRQRPDVRAAEYQVSAALARVGQADAARYPSFRLNGSLGLSALTLGTLTGSGALARAILGSVSVPLFDAGAGKAQVRAQQAALEQTRMSYQATVLTALKDVEDALVALAGDRERLLRLRNAADAAANAALIARQRYASGLVDFQTVLETQRSLFNTQDAVATTTTDLSADHVRLYKALGGGWQPELDSVTITQSSNS
ncbi:efflux transporter outer membrane subunit [Herminiimonas sp. CN]|uniref:efflux transporter outer membrane subunit n=1 Tax=Herminiimonas sp. CN TaxID=1349818 RepID=UPI0004734289|nr:efflux transporter outer membrane subunit [Herminiimonas sp. CN]